MMRKSESIHIIKLSGNHFSSAVRWVLFPGWYFMHGVSLISYVVDGNVDLLPSAVDSSRPTNSYFIYFFITLFVEKRKRLNLELRIVE